MAFLEELKITGSLGNLSFYHMRGVDKIVVRQKGGASREHIRNSPTFKVPRLYMSEFGGCSKMGKEVRFMMHPVRNLSDYNFSGFINKALKVVQKQDGTGELGQRSIILSKHPTLLAGFQLNKSTTFDSVIRTPLTFALRRENLSARVTIPALLRDINFHPNNRHARFRIEVSLGIVPDFTFNTGERVYQAPAWYTSMFTPKSVSSPWYPALKGSPATSLEITLPDQVPADEGYSLMLTVGVRYGSPMEDDVVKEVKRAGVGKVVAIAGQPDRKIPEGKKAPEASAFEDDRKEKQLQSTAPIHAAATCTYGWRPAAAMYSVDATQSSEYSSKAPATASVQVGIESRPKKIEALPIGVSSPGTRAGLSLREKNTRDKVLTPPATEIAAIPFRAHQNVGNGDERPPAIVLTS